MLEQTNNAVYFYAFYTSSKTGKTGLTVTVDVWRNRSEVVTGGSATEMGDGIYYYQLASGTVNAEGEYIAIFKTSDSTVDLQHIPALWVVGKAGVENLDSTVSGVQADTNDIQARLPAALVGGRMDSSVGEIANNAVTAAALATDAVTEVAAAVWDRLTTLLVTAGSVGEYLLAKLGLITSSSGVTVVSPVAASQTVTLIRGDDYKNADGRALSFTFSNAPSITGGTAKLLIDYGVVLEITGTITSSTECYFELTSAQTLTLPAPSTLRYDVQITLSNGNIVTPVQGKMIVNADVR